MKRFRGRRRMSRTHRQSKTLFFLGLMITIAAYLWRAFVVVEGSNPPDHLENKGKILWEKVSGMEKAGKGSEMGELEKTKEMEEDSSLGSFYEDRLDGVSSVKLHCEGTHNVNFFTVDAENEATFDRILHQMEVDTHFENYSKDSDVWGKATVRLEMWVDLPPNSEKRFRCVSYCRQGTPECNILDEEDNLGHHLKAMQNHTDRLLSPLLELTLDTRNRVVRCQGQEEIFAERKSVLEIVDEKGKLVPLEKVEHQVIDGNVVLIALLPPGKDLLEEIRWIMCTLHFAQYYEFLEGWRYLGALLCGAAICLITFLGYTCWLLIWRRYLRLREGQRRIQSLELLPNTPEVPKREVGDPEKQQNTAVVGSRDETPLEEIRSSFEEVHPQEEKEEGPQQGRFPENRLGNIAKNPGKHIPNTKDQLVVKDPLFGKLGQDQLRGYWDNQQRTTRRYEGKVTAYRISGLISGPVKSAQSQRASQ